MKSGQIKRTTAKLEVTNRLREQIASGDLGPGQKLNLKDVSEGMGVSMTPVREAFEQLAAEGLLQRDAYRGARVTELSAEEYEEIYLARVGLEQLAHRLGAENMTPAQCNELARCLTEMEAAISANDILAFIACDRRFHEIIYSVSGRVRLHEKLMTLRYTAERYTRAVFALPHGGMKDTLDSHRDILAACRKNDGAEAARLIAEYLAVTVDSFCAEAAPE